MQTLSPGTKLQHGAYKITKVLGQGGFGITYLAEDVNLQRLVAIKEFFPKDYCDRDDTTSQVSLGTKNTAEFVNRLKAKFLKEARNIARLDHPGIIRIYSAFEENNTAYYVMEYIEGGSLSALVKERGTLTEEKALRYIGKVAEALEYIHARRLNHLDVKPANIMIRKDGDLPILIDFGLSKQYDSDGKQTSTTPTGISHGFAPIEQYNDGGVKEFSPQTDIYSLAATLYYALSGLVPPQATRLFDEQLTFPASVPPRMIGTISKAMSSGRRDRQATVGAFITDLNAKPQPQEQTELPARNHTNAQPTTAKPKSQDQHRNNATGQKKRAVRLVVGSIFIFFVAVLAIFVWQRRDHNADILPTAGMESVTDMAWISPLGEAVYTGKVLQDTLENGEIRNVPNGQGIARVTKGDLKGSVYDGNFVNGVMEGQTKYTLANGDVFTGTFHRNQVEEGRYLSKETGEYFEGSFRDMQPYKGKWYDSNGVILEEL